PSFCFFFNDTATTEIYTLSLHDALPIWSSAERPQRSRSSRIRCTAVDSVRDRKSTRLNSSHANISYAVFCLIKKEKESGRTGSLETRKRADCQASRGED